MAQLRLMGLRTVKWARKSSTITAFSQAG